MLRYRILSKDPMRVAATADPGRNQPLISYEAINDF
jgi:hypothetical protein